MASSPRRRQRKPLITALLSCLTLAMLMLPVAAAQAHDVLEATNPANGSTVATVPGEIDMTYNNTPIAIGSEVLVKDSKGTNWAAGPVSIIDNHVTQAVKPGAPAGTYTVDWRIVSSDSHPIEGTFSFTATKAAASDATAPGPGNSEPAQSSVASSAAGNSGRVPWGIVGGIVVVLLLAALLVVVVRRRIRQSDAS